MGDSLPPKATVDLVASYARRRGDHVEIVLAEPTELLDGDTWATLRRGEDRVRAQLRLDTTGDERRYVVTCERSALSDGRWALFLQGEGDQEQRVNARLLVDGDRPLSLLWGTHPPKSSRPMPYRQRPLILPPAPPVRGAAGTVRGLAGRVRRRILAR
jgi:hypothetical protein